MRTNRQVFHCPFCGDVPRQMLRYANLVGDFPDIARQYRCADCGSSIFAEKVTHGEIVSGNVEDYELPLHDRYYMDMQLFTRNNGMMNDLDAYFKAEKHAMNNGLRLLELLS